MSDLKRTLREAADRRRPPVDWLERIHERARRRRRNQRLAAGVVAFALSFAVSGVLIQQLATEGTLPSGRPSAGPPPKCGSGIGVRPTGWWTGDGTPADSAAGRDAILHGDASFAPGLIGQAFSFDGRGDWAEVPDDPAINVGSGDFTVAFWVRGQSKKGWQVFVEDWVQRGRHDSAGWTFSKLVGGGLLFTLGQGTGNRSVGRPLDLPLDTWIHVAAVRRAETLSILVDGEVVATDALSDPEASSDSSASLKFGHRGGSRDTPGALLDQRMFLRGDLDEILFFVGRGLTDGQIRHIFETQSACTM